MADDGEDGFYVKAAGKAEMSTVSWADVGGLEDNEFQLQLYPTNAFADDPAARLQQVQDLMTAGLLDAKAGRRLLDMPDLEEFENLENASFNLVMKIMTKILKGEEFVGPEPFMDLGEAVKLMQMGYLKGKLDGVPDERLEMISVWISQAQEIVKGFQSAAPLPVGPPGPAPGGPMVGPPPLRPGGPLAQGAAPPVVTNAV